ncbi:nucleoside/nucleotide kinase family protein [Mycoplasmopsis cricetuli]|uniref:hypothetical protein n=1 Tax=Mycoplasmopsis cricetuli TaxID=171283 RepID=UPI0004723FDD|nr:hypothetical protein [Mycoplasmopsis cricetuli]
MIAITGKPCTGKTYFLNLVQKLGYTIFNGDDFVLNLYKDISFVHFLKETKFNFLIEHEKVSKEKIRQIVINDYKLFDEFQAIVHKRVYQHLNKNKYDFIEIAALHSLHSNFIKFVTKIIFLHTDEKTRLENCRKRNVSDKQMKILDTLFNDHYTNKNNYQNIQIIQLNLKDINTLKDIKKILKYNVFNSKK